MIGKLYAWLTSKPASPVSKVDAVAEPVQPSVQAEQIKEVVAENIAKPKRPRSNNKKKKQ